MRAQLKPIELGGRASVMHRRVQGMCRLVILVAIFSRAYGYIPMDISGIARSSLGTICDYLMPCPVHTSPVYEPLRIDFKCGIAMIFQYIQSLLSFCACIILD